MMTIKKNPKEVPISGFIALSMIVIFLLFNAKIINAIPCGTTVHEVFISQFVHIDKIHLMSNLYSLYAISRLEQEMGFKPFIWLFIFLLGFNTLVEFLIKKIYNDLPCSIGFSGILFGLITWELVTKKQLDVELMLAIFIMVVNPSLRNKKVSFIGHAIGAISGIVAGILWKVINKGGL
jgi:membrane associated rhomboid family serine protease